MSARTFELFNPKRKKFRNVEVEKGFCYEAGFGLPSQTTSWNVYLWGSLLAVICMEDVDSLNIHHVKLYNRGYSTVTTKECLNNVLSKCHIRGRIWQYKYDWYFGSYSTNFKQTKIPFFEGIAISPEKGVLNLEDAPKILKPTTEPMRRKSGMFCTLREISKYKDRFYFDNIPNGYQDRAIKQGLIYLKEGRLNITIQGRFEMIKLRNEIEELREKGYDI